MVGPGGCVVILGGCVLSPGDRVLIPGEWVLGSSNLGCARICG